MRRRFRPRNKAKVDAWDWKKFLDGAKKVHAAGFPVGMSIAENTDSNDWLGPLFASHGVFPMNEKNEVTIEQRIAGWEMAVECFKHALPAIGIYVIPSR